MKECLQQCQNAVLEMLGEFAATAAAQCGGIALAADGEDGTAKIMLQAAMESPDATVMHAANAAAQ